MPQTFDNTFSCFIATIKNLSLSTD